MGLFVRLVGGWCLCEKARFQTAGRPATWSQMSDSTSLRLDRLRPHEYGVVDTIDAASDEMQRLMAMGVCPGRLIEVVTPGDPLILKVYGTRIGVSRRLAQKIFVNPGLPATGSRPENPVR